MYKRHKNCTNKFDIVNYADDTTLISTIDSFTSPNTNISDNINSELENVNKWLAAQKLCLNVLKTKYMVFHIPQKRIPKLHLSINNIDIEKVDSFLRISLRRTFEVELSRQESSKQANRL